MRMRNDLAVVACAFVVTELVLIAAGVPFAGVITVLLSLGVATWRLTRRSSNWSALGLNRPASLVRALAAAVGWTVAAFVVAGCALTVAVSALHWPALDASRYGNLSGNLPRLTLLLAVAWTSAAFGEELLFRAFLITRLEALLGSSRGATRLAVAIQAVLFGCAHAFQGPTGMLTSFAIGLLFGAVYARGRNLWPIIIAHGLIDTVGLVTLYFAAKAGA
jgi:membrane protease YdiL (CAAX protease family)